MPKFVKQLTRENTLLDRGFRTLAYAQANPRVSKANMFCPIVGKGRVTELYRSPNEFKTQQKIILKDFSGNNLNRKVKLVMKGFEAGYIWAKQNSHKKLSRLELVKYIKTFNFHHANARAGIVYGYWAEPAITKKLKIALSNRVARSKLDQTLSLLSVPKPVVGVLSKLHVANKILLTKHNKLIAKLKLNKQEQELVEILRWFTLFYEMSERVSAFLYKEFLKHLKQTVGAAEFINLEWYDPDSLIKYLQGNNLTSYELNERKQFYVLTFIKNKLFVLSGSGAKQYYNKYFAKEEICQSKILKGTVACVGKAKGRVKIVITQNDMTKMQKGDILVSTMTTPYLIAAVKKAGAIVTDEGGLTAHAAIVSRELNIPCIVGTKFATKFLKDGDLVLVDAERGVVKRG